MNLLKGFVYLSDIDASIAQDIKYATDDNLIGRTLAGYHQPVAIITEPVALALAAIQQQLKKQNLGLLVYETYRPMTAAHDMYAWSQNLDDQKNKADYYPNVNKADFYKLGYINMYSVHSRGAAVDVTVINLETKQALDMGTRFDFMDELSYPTNRNVSELVYSNRQVLRNLMHKHGFTGIHTEWWHFNFVKELFPDTYFEFPVV